MMATVINAIYAVVLLASYLTIVILLHGLATI